MLASGPEDVARRLKQESTLPPAEVSRERLSRAGWQHDVREVRAGNAVRVSISNGRQTIQAEGKNTVDAWYTAAVQALGQRAADGEETPMTPTIQAAPVPVPLRAGQGGAFRVGDSRVSLDTVINEYDDGADPEEIVHAYPTLALADVYAVIAYYLRHQDEVKAYLRHRQEEAAELRREIESKQPDRAGLRAKLLARRAQQEQGHASPGG
jgi:uncharacterized protein (DUF433 family)